MPSVSDLIVYSTDQKPIEFQNALNDLLVSKISDAIHDRKIQIAQTMFNKQDEAEPEEYSDDETT